MANDYHIYIHSDISGNANKTVPSQNKPEEQQNEIVKFSDAYSSAKKVASNGAVETGVSALTKVAPWVAAIVIAAKVTDHIVSTGFAHIEEYTGNFQNNVNYNNFKTGLHNALHPVSFGLSMARQRAQWNKQNIAIKQQNELVGNSILKDMNVGV